MIREGLTFPDCAATKPDPRETGIRCEDEGNVVQCSRIFGPVCQVVYTLCTWTWKEKVKVREFVEA